MKYIAYWLGTAAVLTIAVLVGVGGVALVSIVTANPALAWVPLVILGVIALSTLVAVIEYLTDRRQPATIDVIPTDGEQ